MSLKNLPYLGSRDDYISVRIDLAATCLACAGANWHVAIIAVSRRREPPPSHKPAAQLKRKALPSTSLWQSALPSLSGNALERCTQIAAPMFY